MRTRPETKNASGGHGVALLLVDVMNPFDFEGGAAFARRALRPAQTLARLRDRAYRAGAAVVYANDHFGRWHSDFRQVVAECSAPDSRGAQVAALLPPREDDHAIIKPKHSAFFATPLDMLLQHLGVHTLVIGGYSGDGCVLATALDAHMRDYRVRVPPEASVSATAVRQRAALTMLEANLDDAVVAGNQVNFARLRRPP